MTPLFRTKIAAYRAQKLAAYQAEPSWARTVLALNDDEPPSESLLWRIAWAIGIEIPPEEFLSPAANFSAEFFSCVLVIGGSLAVLLTCFPYENGPVPILALCIGVVLLATVRGVMAAFRARTSRRTLGFATWDALASFDEPDEIVPASRKP